jgi:GlcNAc-P-P-Und epimerase
VFRILITGGSGFIGTNFVDELHGHGVPLLNLDIQPPKRVLHTSYWQECDILDLNRTFEFFESFQPTHVIHLAARTDTLSNELDDYRENFNGTENILRCITLTPSVQRVIIASSQFVYAPPGLPASDNTYNPIGAYGMSKILSEKATRAAELSCTWTIIRPTNIWGPWHPRYPKEFWLVLKKGLYFHPDGKPTMRSYGYVKNIIYQVLKLMDADPEVVNRKVYYVGDPPVALLDWTNGFSMAITGKPVRVIPRGLVWFLAVVGSFLAKFKIRFPITLSRYRSMTEDYFSPVDKTIQCVGPAPYSLKQGIEETVRWLDAYWAGNAS